MTLYQFICLDKAGQEQVLWTGTYLAVRIEKGNMVQLYSLGSFYIEIYYSPSSNQIVKLRPFSSIELLDPYLNQIEVG